MIHPACLPLPADQLTFNEGVAGTIIAVVMLMLAVSVLLSPLMRQRYRRKVTRLMGMNQLMPQVTEATTSLPEPPRAPRPAFDATRLQTWGEQAERRIRRATLVAGVVFSGMAFVMGWLKNSSASEGLAFVLMAMVVAAGPAHCNWPSRKLWRARGLMWGALAIGATVCWGMWPETQQDALETSAREAVLFGLACGATYFAMFHRSLRGQVLPVLCLALVWMLAFVGLTGLAEQQLGTCWKSLASAKTGVLAMSAQHMVFMLPMLLGLWLGLRALARLSSWLDQGWLSDLSVISLYTLVIWAALLCFSLELHGGWTALLLVAWVGVTVVAYALALGPLPHDGPAPQLLMLRVFSNDSRHHNLLDVVQGHWRLLGPVHQIGGPDMVAMNVDPHEAMKFLTNRLHELFLPTGIGLADLQARLVTQPDKEGRFRINEVFCFNTAWQATVVQLMQLSDVVLLDVRGMSDNRHGTGFEIAQLATRGLLRRVLAVGNAQTNWLHVDELVRKAGQPPALMQRVREDELVGDELFTKLCEVAGSDLGLAEEPGSAAAATGALG